MARRKRTRRQGRSERSPHAWPVLALVVVVAAAAGFLLWPRSLPPAPLQPPRLVTRGPMHAPSPVASASAVPEPRALAPEPSVLDERASAGPPAVGPSAAPPAEGRAADRRPRVAIIIDDLGDNIDAARAVLALEPAVTIAVIPFRASSARIAAAAVERGREVILHLPLEPDRAAEMGDAPGFLHVGMSAGALEQQLEADLAAVPYIVGVNGHMGSRFTRDAVAMERLLVALRARGLFFLDSLTSPGSVAAATAARVGIPFAERSVFLDHDVSAAAVARALARVDALLHDGRDVIAIGHPHPTTIAALRPWLVAAARRGVTVVPASALVR